MKENEMAGACSTHMGRMRKAYNILVGKSEGKRPLRRPRHRWENNVRMNLMEVW
jgi:hypothetical protein